MKARIEQIESGFIQAMYFADESESGELNQDGFYDDGLFNGSLKLSENALQNIKDILQHVLKLIPAEPLLELTNDIDLERIGMCIYYDIQGHGVGFNDENISDELKQLLSDIIDYNFYVELYDDGQFVQFSYSYKG